MKLLIAVKSHEGDRVRGANQLVRDTWGKDVEDADLVFFQGQPEAVLSRSVQRRLTSQTDLKGDEVIIDAPDSYAGLPLKTRAICRWAVERDYDFVFFTDTGSFVIPHHLLSYDLQHDYVGYWGLANKPFYFEAANTHRGCPTMTISSCWPWASGGGYQLSNKAMKIVAENDPVFWAEDTSVGQVLAANGIFLEDKAHDGFHGYVVNWIHNENNERTDAMLRRTRWMHDQYEEAKRKCAAGCDGPLWDRKPQVRTYEPTNPEKEAQ